MFEQEDIISGERIQQIADMYLGTAGDFIYNPAIFEQIEKHQILDDIDGPFDNPPTLFLYSHLLKQFAEKLLFFENPFTLITHNSDFNLTESDPTVKQILNSEKLVRWWGQNLCFIHQKMRILPIGIANAMWDHGKVENFVNNPIGIANAMWDHGKVYFNFNIYTNREKRESCYNAFKDRYEFLPMLSVAENARRLAQYKWCICPEGNGVDTHRLWEAMYLGSIPIVLKSPFIDALMHYTEGELPIYVIDSWSELKLPNDVHGNFDSKWLKLSHWVFQITSAQ
jgi:hypothetical protein